jgi:hypothetical protein
MKPLQLANGLILCFTDRSRRYFGDYHQVRIQVQCSVPLLPDYFVSREAYEHALRILGDEIPYSLVLERMGVAGAETGGVKELLLKHFAETTGTYLSSPLFPARYVARTYAHRLTRTVSVP